VVEVKKKRRWRRWMVRGLLLLVVLVAALLVFYRPLLRQFVLPRVGVVLEEVLGLRSEIVDVALTLPGTLTVTGIRCSRSRAVPKSALGGLEVSRLAVDLSLWGAIQGERDFLQRVAVDVARIDLDLDRTPFLPEIAAEGEADDRIDESPPLELPEIVVTVEDLRLSRGDDRLHLRGVEFALRGSSLELDVRERFGEWSTPRLESFEFPLHARVSLAGRPEDPFAKLVVESLILDDKVITSELVIEAVTTNGEDVVTFAGFLPAWGFRSVQGEIGHRFVSLSAETEDLHLAEFLRFFLDPPLAFDAVVSGPLKVRLPLESPAEWSASADLTLADVWALSGSTSSGIVVSDARVTVERLPTGPLECLAHFVDLEWQDRPPFEVTTRLTWTPGDGSTSLWEIDDLTVFQGERRLAGSATLRLDGTRFHVDGAQLEAFDLPLASISPFLGDDQLPPGILNARLHFRGSDDRSTWEAGGRLSLSVDDPDGAPMQISVAPTLAACRVGIEGAVRRGDDWMRFDLALDETGDSTWSVSLGGADGDLLGEPFLVESPSELEFGSDGYRVGALEAHFFGGRCRVSADGAWQGTHRLELEVVDLPVTTDRLLVLFPEESFPQEAVRIREFSPEGMLSVHVVGDFDWRGWLRDFDVDARVELSSARLVLGDHRVEGVDAEFLVAADPEIVVVESASLRQGDDWIRCSGSVPLEWLPGPQISAAEPVVVSLYLRCRDLVATLPLPKEQIRELAGVVEVELDFRTFVSGSELYETTVEARATIHDGTLRLHGDLPAFEEIVAEARVDDNHIHLDKLSGTIGGSEVEISGGLEITPPWTSREMRIETVDLRLKGEKALLVRQPELRARGDLDLRWHGPWERSTVEGQIEITRVYYLQDVKFASVRPSLPFDLFRVEAPPFRDAVLDVRVLSDRNIVVLNNLINTRASAALHLGGTGMEPLLTGRVSTDNGKVRVGNTKISIRSGIVEFREKDLYNPELQILLGDRMSGYDVTVTVVGDLENPELILDSSPSLERDRLLVLVTTGYTPQRIDETGAERVAAIEAAKYIGSSVAAYIFRGSDPTEASIFDRFTVHTEGASESYQEDLFRLEVRVIDEVWPDGQIFVQSERDFYGDYNFNLGWRIEVK